MFDDDSGSTFFLVLLVVFIICKWISSDDYDEIIEENATKYETEIDEYNNDIEEYAKNINSLELDHLKIIMKVMKDQWEQYKYCTDEDLITGYYRLSFQEKGYGVCTSFADDFTAKINAINPEYEAKNVICYLTDNDEEINMVDIERTNLEYSENEDNIFAKIFSKSLTKKYGNHMVTMMRIPEEDYYLIVDSTNLMIGVIKDGDIYMFNSSSFDTIEYIEKGNITLCGKDCVKEEDINYECDTTLTELEAIYGYEMQEEAIEDIEDIEKGIQKQLRLN